MAKDRCISTDVLMNDNFMSLPNSAKVLYIYFNQNTDNLGFVDNLASIMAITKAKPKDLQLLIEKEYIIQVKDWLYLETHFRLNNKNLRPERGKKSRFTKYLEDYEVDESDMYVLSEKCRQNVGNLSAICPKNSEQSKVKENKVKEINLKERNIKESIIDSPDELRAFMRGQI